MRSWGDGFQIGFVLETCCRLSSFARERMCFQPQHPSGGTRINTGLDPPRRLITGSMDFAMMSPAQWYTKFIADLTPQCRGLRKSQVVCISGTAAADQARLLGN